MNLIFKYFKKLNFRARPWIYLLLSPFIGFVYLTSLATYTSFFGTDLSMADWLTSLYITVALAYFVGAIPALLTGLVVELTSRMLRKVFMNTKLRFIIVAAIGLGIAISVTVIFLLYRNEMEELYILGFISALAFSIYGAISAIVCEFCFLKKGRTAVQKTATQRERVED